MERSVKGFHLDPVDNVVTVIQTVQPGDRVFWEDPGTAGEIWAVTAVPRFHKIAVAEIPVGSPVTKYGHIIGVATQTIPNGAHVHTQNCRGTAVEELNT